MAIDKNFHTKDGQNYNDRVRHEKHVWRPGKWEKSLPQLMAEYEIKLIKLAMFKCGMSKSNASHMMGIKRTTLVEKMKRYGLTKEGISNEVIGQIK